MDKHVMKMRLMESLRELLGKVQRGDISAESAFTPWYRERVAEYGAGRRMILELLKLEGWTLKDEILVRLR